MVVVAAEALSREKSSSMYSIMKFNVDGSRSKAKDRKEKL